MKNKNSKEHINNIKTDYFGKYLSNSKKNCAFYHLQHKFALKASENQKEFLCTRKKIENQF